MAVVITKGYPYKKPLFYNGEICIDLFGSFLLYVCVKCSSQVNSLFSLSFVSHHTADLLCDDALAGALPLHHHPSNSEALRHHRYEL